MTKKIKQIFIMSAVSGLIATAHADLVLKLDQDILGNTPMPITENVGYDILSQQVTVTTKYPVICNQIEGSATASNLIVAVNSPNKDNISSGVIGLLQSIDYNISGGEITMVSENLNKSLCVTSILHDVIYETSFSEHNYENHFKFTGIESSQPVNTQMTVGTEYVNNSGAVQDLDYIEYWPHLDDLDVYANSNGVNCSIYDGQGGFVGSCPMDFSKLGQYKNIVLNPGHKIVTSNNLIIHGNSTVGEYLYLMTGVFTKSGTIQSIGQSQSFSSVDFIEARIKVAQTP